MISRSSFISAFNLITCIITNKFLYSQTLNVADKIPFKYKDRRVETSHLKEWVTKFESRNDRIGTIARELIDKWDKLPSCGPELNELQKQDAN